MQERRYKNYEIYKPKSLPVAKNSLEEKQFSRLRTTNSYGVGKNQLACCIFSKKDGLISLGQNSYKTHPLQKQFGYNQFCVFMHAEIEALVCCLRTDYSPKGKTLAVKRYKEDVLDTSFPCDGCMEAIKHFGIKTIVYYDAQEGLRKVNV